MATRKLRRRSQAGSTPPSPVRAAIESIPIVQPVPAGNTKAGQLAKALSSLTPGLKALAASREALNIRAGQELALAQQLDSEQSLTDAFAPGQTRAFQDAMAKVAAQASVLKSHRAAKEDYALNRERYTSGELQFEDLIREHLSLEGVEDQAFRQAALPVAFQSMQELRNQFRADSAEFILAQRDRDFSSLAAEVVNDPNSTALMVGQVTDRGKNDLDIDRTRIMEMFMNELRIAGVQGKPGLFSKFIEQANNDGVGVAASPKTKVEFFKLLEQAKSVAKREVDKRTAREKFLEHEMLLNDARNGTLPRARMLNAMDAKLITAPQGTALVEVERKFIGTEALKRQIMSIYDTGGDAGQLAALKGQEFHSPEVEDGAFDRWATDQLQDAQTPEAKQQAWRTIIHTSIATDKEYRPLIEKLKNSHPAQRGYEQSVQIASSLMLVGGEDVVRGTLGATQWAQMVRYQNARAAGQNNRESADFAQNVTREERERGAQMMQTDDGKSVVKDLRSIAEQSTGLFGIFGDAAQNSQYVFNSLKRNTLTFLQMGMSLEQAQNEATRHFESNNTLFNGNWINNSVLLNGGRSIVNPNMAGALERVENAFTDSRRGAGKSIDPEGYQFRPDARTQNDGQLGVYEKSTGRYLAVRINPQAALVKHLPFFQKNQLLENKGRRLKAKQAALRRQEPASRDITGTSLVSEKFTGGTTAMTQTDTAVRNFLQDNDPFEKLRERARAQEVIDNVVAPPRPAIPSLPSGLNIPGLPTGGGN